MKSKIAVVGSINIDYVVETDTFPRIGETVLGKNFFFSPGGKGANQAVAASRLGGDVSLFGSVGRDENGSIVIEKLKGEELDITNIRFVENVPTGAALIELSNGDNRIIVVSGANNYTDTPYIKEVMTSLLSFDVILFQLETPVDMMNHIIPILSENGKTIIVNPAPAIRLEEELIEKISYLTPNEHEYQTVLGTDLSIEEVVRNYPSKVIITQGARGVKYSDGKDIIEVPSIKVTPLDTTGAGDTFSGAFAVAVGEGKPLYESIQFANIAAGISITKKGAQSGMPSRNEVDELLNKEVNIHEDQNLFTSD